MLNGVSVIVTRPQAQAETLKKTLSGLGAVVIALPGLEILPIKNNRLETTFLDLDRFQHVIFTSINAACLGMDHLDSYWPQWPVGIEWYAVGAGTAKILAKFHIQAHLPEKYHSEGLLALPGLQNLAEQNVLIVKGEGGRPLLADTLKARGAELKFADVYRRGCPSVCADKQRQVQQALDANGPLIMVVSSIESLKNLQLLLASDWTRLHQRPLLVVSERIAQHARHLGFQNISVSPKPDDGSVIEALGLLIKRV